MEKDGMEKEWNIMMIWMNFLKLNILTEREKKKYKNNLFNLNYIVKLKINNRYLLFKNPKFFIFFY